MPRRRWKIILLIIILPPFLLACFLLLERVRGKISLARYKRHLTAKGEKLTPAEFLAKMDPNAENSAPALWAAVGQLGEGVITTNTPPRMRLLPSGRAIIGFREDHWVESQLTNSWDEVSEELRKNQSVLTQIRFLLQKPFLRNIMDYAGGPNIQLPHLIKAKHLTHWFGTSAGLALNEGRANDVLENLLTEIRIPQSLAEDRLLISELVRIAIAAIARSDTWEALQADVLSENALAQIQDAWQQQEFATTMARGFEGEVVFAESTYQIMRRSNKETALILFFLQEYSPDTDLELIPWNQLLSTKLIKFLRHQVYCPVWRFAWLDQDELHYLHFLEDLVNEARQTAKSKKLPEVDYSSVRLAEQLSHMSFYNRLRFPNAEMAASITRCMARAMHAETERSMVVAAIALKRFELRYGKVPANLDALTPEFLKTVPIDPMDGKPIKYKLNSERRYVLYSVGDDRQDDSGSLDLASGKTNPRLLWDRKDLVWPAPATPEEMERYHKERRN